MNNDLIGRWETRNGLLVAMHINPTATEGNSVERYIGHALETQKIITIQAGGPTEITVSPAVRFCWNENGECVWMQGIVDRTDGYDIMSKLMGDRWNRERGLKVASCWECRE